MAKYFTVNGIEYIAKDFDYNMICDLEDMGISMSEAQEKPLSLVRAYFASCTGRGKGFSGSQIEEHIMNGGDFNELIEIMVEKMDESDFFRTLQQGTKKKTTTSQKKPTKKAE